MDTDKIIAPGIKSYPLSVALQMEALIRELPTLNASALPWVHYKAKLLVKELETYGPGL